MIAVADKPEPWRRRLYLPNYQVLEAARYARVSAKTVTDWQRAGERQALPPRERRVALSYMQLIEVAVVAAFRTLGVPLKEIRASREYAAKQLKSEFPFAEYRFKTDGKSLFQDYKQYSGKSGDGKLIQPGRGGQLSWDTIIGRLEEFDYEKKGIVLRWHVAGEGSPILIDPRVAFGAPAVSGIPTWALKGRWNAGEPIPEIAEDFDLSEGEVAQALSFEGVELEGVQWKH